MAKISVAMAVYNGEKYLAKQLDSILNQLEATDEIVASYDKSTDNSLALLEDYAKKDPRVKVFINENKGVAGNFGNAVKNCTGDYIFICDQDDIWQENKRETVVADFESSGADMVIHNGVHINGEDKVISEPFFTTYRIGDGKLKNIIKPRYSGCCTAFTANMAKKILPIPQKIDAYDHWIGTIGEFMGKIYYEEKVLLYHRLHGNNVTPDKRRSVTVILKARTHLLFCLAKRIKRERGKN
jgi:glycosyltransferase involved in cell wall biosynthesis